jgi:hypothetical protein
VASTPTNLITVPAIFRFSCHLQQLMTTASLMTPLAAKEYLVFKIGSKRGSRIFAKAFNVLLLLPLPRPSPSSLQLPFPTTCLASLSLPATSRAASFPLHCRIFSASIYMTPPSSTFILPDLQHPVVKANSHDHGSNLFYPRGRRAQYK